MESKTQLIISIKFDIFTFKSYSNPGLFSSLSSCIPIIKGVYFFQISDRLYFENDNVNNSFLFKNNFRFLKLQYSDFSVLPQEPPRIFSMFGK